MQFLTNLLQFCFSHLEKKILVSSQKQTFLRLRVNLSHSPCVKSKSQKTPLFCILTKPRMFLSLLDHLCTCNSQTHLLWAIAQSWSHDWKSSFSSMFLIPEETDNPKERSTQLLSTYVNLLAAQKTSIRHIWPTQAWTGISLCFRKHNFSYTKLTCALYLHLRVMGAGLALTVQVTS